MNQSLLEAVNNFQETELEEFQVEFTRDGVCLVIDGHFTQSGESIYANFNDMNLCAGSQDSNKDYAKVKSIVRLIEKIESRILFYKTRGDFKGLLLENEDTKLSSLIEYSKKLESKHQDGEIPVYVEKFKEQGNGWYIYTTKRRSSVKDLSSIQESQMDTLNNHGEKGSQLVKETFTILNQAGIYHALKRQEKEYATGTK